VHPYTQALLSAAPIADPKRREESERILLQGDLPSPSDPPSGCRFRTRCWLFNQMEAEDEGTGDNRTEKCISEDPSLETQGFDHPSACHYPQERQIIATVERERADVRPDESKLVTRDERELEETVKAEEDAAITAAEKKKQEASEKRNVKTVDDA
jgi:oligopeptide/dipeptide ABC transporter ATP-binding protein